MRRIYEVLESVRDKAKLLKDNKKIEYYQIPCSMDIETSSFISSDNEKHAIMYVGAFNLNHNVIFFRTWEEYKYIMKMIVYTFRLNDKRRLIIYVHNLSYEFQWIRKKTEFQKVFALDIRKPVYAITDGIEFRCSYKLTNYSLKALATIYKLGVEKLDEEYDYYKIRTPETELEAEEYGYLYHDTEIVVRYIEKIMKDETNISYIPITKTAYVRRLVKNNCNSYKYRKSIRCLTIEEEEYAYLKKAFQGGFTHANLYNAGKVLNNVASFDFGSDYPARMVSEKFPMGKGELIENPTREEYLTSINKYCCILEIEIERLDSKGIGEHILSYSKCITIDNYCADNGRIISGENIKIVITEIDLKSLKMFYRIKGIKINKIYRYAKSYLPKDFINVVLDLYEKKTTLKGIEEKEDEYMRSKEDINSLYGMCVTDIVRELIEYNDEWLSEKPIIQEALKKYNNKYDRTLFYPWGVWVTAYARYYLFEAIYNVRRDYCYSDTDSIKLTNKERYSKYFYKANDSMERRIRKICKFYNLDKKRFSPKTSKGKVKTIGLWEYEGTYNKFKTLGAKRYLIEENGIHKITVAGLNKNSGMKYLEMISKRENKSIFDLFDDNLVVPSDYSGRLEHFYGDEEINGKITDYKGDTYEYHEDSFVYLESVTYSMNISDTYIKLLMNRGITSHDVL